MVILKLLPDLVHRWIKSRSKPCFFFSNSHIWMWEVDRKEVECQSIDAFELWCWEKTLESPLDCKEIKSVNLEGNQSWIFLEKTSGEAEAPILWPLDEKSRLFGKDPDAGKDWRQEEKGMTEDEMLGWHHWLNGHEFEQTLGDSEGQGSLASCSSWGHKKSDMTEQIEVM